MLPLLRRFVPFQNNLMSRGIPHLRNPKTWMICSLKMRRARMHRTKVHRTKTHRAMPTSKTIRHPLGCWKRPIRENAPKRQPRNALGGEPDTCG